MSEQSSDPLRARAEQITQAVERLRTEVAISRDIGMNQNDQFANDIETVLDQLASLTAAHERAIKALRELLAMSSDPSGVTGEYDTAAGRARRLLNAVERDGGASQA